MNQVHKNALRYIENTNGGATHDNFIEDHEPIGGLLWQELFDQCWVKTDDADIIMLTDMGKAALK